MTMAPLELWRTNERLARAKGAGDLIPTWQTGQPQPQPAGLRRYMEEGYSSNSLIYACIREKATSFASLDPILVRADGKPIKRHRMLDLIGNPNTYQDRFEFNDLLVTQYEAAGNAYIHKVRVSLSPARRREFAGYPVQELQLIRPDYVTIEPGRSRADDVFVVTIDGVERLRLPATDVIHLHEPSLTNDFYGLSKIAVLAQEGSIDYALSSYELAYFRNAGVPFGILKIKGRTTPDEIAQVKSRFRQAYSGVRKWFDLLVLNQDSAEYQQLGNNPADMEADGTRFHAESRICAVFGVPPLIVGARLAYAAGAGGVQYDSAQFQFWSETMVPLARTIGGSYERALLSEFALIADTGAHFTYDFTQVRALQEDRSRKLREVVRLIITGGFTTNQALTMVGLPSIEGGDNYIRQGNQVVVSLDGTLTPMAGAPEQVPQADNPLVGAAAVSEAERIIKEPRCGGVLKNGRPCNKLMARSLGPGSMVECDRCGAVMSA